MDITQDRLFKLMRHVLGDLTQFFTDDTVTEIIRNSNGSIWIDTHTGLKEVFGPEEGTKRLSDLQALQIINTVAHGAKTIVDEKNPIISSEMPESSFRFEGLIPPNVEAPAFNIRKKSSLELTIDNFPYSNERLEETLDIEKNSFETPADVIKDAIKRRLNILVVGGTGSGKTALTNSIIKMIPADERIVFLEDTRELKRDNSTNSQFLKTSDYVDLTRLLKSTLRLRPDRIVVGEIRGKEAIDLISAWNTGHPGGIATIHADSTFKALARIEQYISIISQNPQKENIADAINLVIFIKKELVNGKNIRRIKSILRVIGIDQNKNYITQEVIIK